MLLLTFLGGSNVGLLMFLPRLVGPTGVLVGLIISAGLVHPLPRKDAVWLVLLGLVLGVLATVFLCAPILDHFPMRGFPAVVAYGLAVMVASMAPATLARVGGDNYTV
jgi:hypothetical protein